MEINPRRKMKKKINPHNTTEKKKEEEEEEENNNSSYCYSFFRAMKEQNPHLRHSSLSTFFQTMPYHDHQEHVLIMSSLWSIAMTHPADTDLPSVGALRCMSLLISKGLSNPSWLLRHQNIYIPYYAAHILGSYTIRLPSLANLAVESGAIPPLLDLFRGRMTWVEQRVAVRALGHLASYDSTFPAVAQHGQEVVSLASRVASSCLETVYVEFVGKMEREKYHRDLLTRGLGGAEMENRKAEEWASQLQCWSLYLMSCFAWRDRSSHLWICGDVGFLRKLCRMWGGLVNGDSPAGVGLMRILCRSEVGREAMAGCSEIIESLCNLSRSSNDWQYMGIDCLLLLIQDPKTRHKVMNIAGPCLLDLSELRNLGARKRLGETITEALGASDIAIKMVERRKREETMSEEELVERKSSAVMKKQQGNRKFWSGNIEEAIIRYTEALELCPLKWRKERVVLYSNRAQCHLLLRDPDAAISDATRALSVSSPANGHGKSLWRRSQAYDMKGLAKESLMDCIMFVNGWFDGRRSKVPYYAARMINKQMTAAGLFAGTAVKSDETVDGCVKVNMVSELGLETIEEEPRLRRRRRKGKEEERVGYGSFMDVWREKVLNGEDDN